jgi:hypothetical protein
MREEWFTALSLEAAISAAKKSAFGGEGYSLIDGPVNTDSAEGRQLSPSSSAPTKGRAAVRAKGYRL